MNFYRRGKIKLHSFSPYLLNMKARDINLGSMGGGGGGGGGGKEGCLEFKRLFQNVQDVQWTNLGG